MSAPAGREHCHPVTTRAEAGVGDGRSTRAAIWVGAGIFFSKVSGVIREVVFANYFGASAVADVWRVAHVDSGEDPALAAAMAQRTSDFYTGS